MTFAPAYLTRGVEIDHGQIAASFYDHTDVDSDGSKPNGPLMRLISFNGTYFLPVAPGMRFVAYLYYDNGSRVMVPITLTRTEDGYATNLWRHKQGLDVEPLPNLVTPDLSWEILGRSGQIIAGRVDRALRDSGDDNRGVYQKFVVSTDTTRLPNLGGIEQLNQLTIWRRTRRAPEGSRPKGEHSTTGGTDDYAENAEMLGGPITLIWRDAAERLLRTFGDAEIGW